MTCAEVTIASASPIHRKNIYMLLKKYNFLLCNLSKVLKTMKKIIRPTLVLWKITRWPVNILDHKQEIVKRVPDYLKEIGLLIEAPTCFQMTGHTIKQIITCLGANYIIYFLFKCRFISPSPCHPGQRAILPILITTTAPGHNKVSGCDWLSAALWKSCIEMLLQLKRTLNCQ